ncbi:helix-turn-helix domain-containing protein [Xanthobacter sp. KR7-225]|uniref:helix-turn-helix domain-containing protein n=1 Tax=Xanthobacter sp. KR7-225 TaxID=3156613 RepID=UPI0032B51D02
MTRQGLALRAPDPEVPVPAPPLPPLPPRPPRRPAEPVPPPPGGLIARRIRIVQEVVAAHYGLNARALASRTKIGKYTLPRQVAMAVTRRVVGRSWEEIGAAFGGRAHSTVLRSVERVEARQRMGLSVADDLTRLEAEARAAILSAERHHG